VPDTTVYDMIEVVLPEPGVDDPHIVCYGVEPDGQMALLLSIQLGPFPDWESISRRVMRQVVLASKVSLG
jgi:hypothetical protein